MNTTHQDYQAKYREGDNGLFYLINQIETFYNHPENKFE